MNKTVFIDNVEVSAFSSIDDAINSAIYTSAGIIPGVAIAVNPEKIIAARTNEQLQNILTKATLKYPDGVGVSYVMGKKLKKKVARIPGCELWERLMLKSVKQQIPVFLIGAKEEVIAKTKNKLLTLNVNVVGYQNGYFDKSNPEQLINDISSSGAQIVSVALGSPSQEMFIFECQKRLPNIFYMGVGGTYDVFTGNVKRAPLFFRKLRCEWLYRLLSQPTRIGRQTNLLKYIYLYLKGAL